MLFLSILLYTILSYSCTSPIDVNANRQVMEYNDSNKELSGKELHFNVYEINFIDVAYGSSQAQYVVISNLSNRDILIGNFRFSKYENLFKITHPKLPILLTKIGTDNSSRELMITFTANELGEITDTLFIENMQQPQLIINAKVPYVDVIDVDFGFQKIGQSKVKPPLYIYNHSRKPIIINSYRLVDPEDAFQVLSSLPIEIPPTSKYSVIIKFTPQSEKPYNGRIEFKIDGVQGYIDNTAQLSGYGIK